MEAKTFEEAVALTKKFTNKPSNAELLKLYGLYKQATEGDNKEDRPGGFDFVAEAKYDSWQKYSGKTKDEAKETYILFVNTLAPTYI
jgi:diazepam-binding inhibitor (GABA receptor modulator, acyl-CoA-binding protein)